jgi:hypothetical protein
MRSTHVVSGVAFALATIAIVLGPRTLAMHAAAGAQRTSSAEIIDIDGHPLNPFGPAGAANVIFFIATDCPMSNTYAPEIQRVCKDYGPRDVTCSLIYEDVDLAPSASRLDANVRKHLLEYRYSGIPAAIDRDRVIAKRAKASVTPEAVVIDRSGKMRYRGRIDNFYAALGKTRREVTEHDLRDALDAVLSGKAVPKSQTEALGCFIVDPAELRK